MKYSEADSFLKDAMVFAIDTHYKVGPKLARMWLEGRNPEFIEVREPEQDSDEYCEILKDIWEGDWRGGDEDA